MLNSRSVPEPLWEHARRVLIFYFAHRGALNAEDLAQDTLAELLRRDDYEFEKEEDFQRVCYAFARRIWQSGYRRERKHAASALDESQLAPEHRAFGLNKAEMAVFLTEVIEAGKTELGERDWRIIEESVAKDADIAKVLDRDGANRGRVRLHRARQKLRRLVGWTD